MECVESGRRGGRVLEDDIKEEDGRLYWPWKAMVRTLGERKQSEEFEQKGKLVCLTFETLTFVLEMHSRRASVEVRKPVRRLLLLNSSKQ